MGHSGNVPVRRLTAEGCPNAVDPNHRTGPTGYIVRANWAENMLKTHRQEQCPVCGLWVVWVPKP